VITRSIGLHLILFAAASALGLRAWTAEDEPNKNPVAAELWSGRLSDLQKIEFRTDKKRVALEPREDALGRYYVGSIETLKAPPPAADGPDAGLDKADQGTLEVTIAGTKHSLQLGEKTPGGSDRYVQNPETGEAYVMAGSIANDLQSADSRLIERDFHDFGDEKLGKVVLQAGDKRREIVRHGDEKDFWSRPDSPETKDETVSNWMTKVDRLRVTTYVETLDPAPKPEDQVVSVEYFNDKGRKLGFFELVRRPSKDGKEKPDYVARSERTRWHATVLRSTAEQIDQDLASVVTP
jgi:hypothetical protein